MGQRFEIPISRRQGLAKSKFVSAQTLKNAFLELDPETGDASLYGAPGLTLFAATGGLGLRGAHKFVNTILAVSGTRLYTVTEAGVATNQGEIAGTLNVIIADNGSQAVIVADEASYVWDGSVLVEITDVDFTQASSVDFIDQYMVFTRPDTDAFFLSALSDATSYDALDIASAESRPDVLRRVVVDNREALLFGSETVEGWYNAGDADFPLVRDQTFVETGLIGKYAVARVDNSVAWLASDRTVRILRGGTPQIISDPFVSAEIETWADASTTVAFSFTVRGHQFLALRNDDGCLLWDASLPPQLAWSSRASHDSDTWRVNCAVSIWDQTIVGDAENGKLYVLDQDAYDENGDPLVGELTSRVMSVNGRPFTLDALEVEIEPGVSLVSGQGSDATVYLEASRDSGYSYGARLERSLGEIGVRPRRIVWRSLGDFPPHGGVLKLGWSDPVRIVMTKAYAEITANAA